MEKTFRAGESVDEAQVMKTEMQFSYDDGDSYQFMNLETYETEGVPKTVFETNNQGSFLLEGMVVQVRTERLLSGNEYIAGESHISTPPGAAGSRGIRRLLTSRFFCSINAFNRPSNQQITKWNDRTIDAELPPNYIYEVVETDPNFKGNTAQGASKPAKLNSGATVTVPMFIEVGEKIKVDTREATYLSRGDS